jgi:phosphoribosyl-ATP pyrophosphohydrolase/phosphoribosyl-AMP cyclohydrolase
VTRVITLDPAEVAWGASGLVAAVVQDATDGRVLMVGWQDAEALGATLATGEVHFHSRSRDRLWRKGESSGNVLRLVGARLDCDADAILLTVEATGPTCHTGTRSCFDGDGDGSGDGDGDGWAQADASLPGRQGFDWLETLWATIADRVRSRPEGSYTARLLEGGVDAVARKVAEEAIEVVLAAKDDQAAARDSAAPRDQSALAGEVADLLYHTLVLLAERGLRPDEVMAVLRARHAAAAAPAATRR